MGRQKDDFYPTPPEATELLLTVEKFKGDIWECASGNGAISKCLQKANYNVISTDLNDYGYGETGRDFLQETKSLADNIVTNPPFKLAESFIQKCIEQTHDIVEGRPKKKWFRYYCIRMVCLGKGL